MTRIKDNSAADGEGFSHSPRSGAQLSGRFFFAFFLSAQYGHLSAPAGRDRTRDAPPLKKAVYIPKKPASDCPAVIGDWAHLFLAASFAASGWAAPLRGCLIERSNHPVEFVTFSLSLIPPDWNGRRLFHGN